MGKWCIGIDLGGTFIKFVLVDREGSSDDVFELPTPDSGADAVALQMAAGARQAMESRGLSLKDVTGVGIGSPGPLNISEGIVRAMPNIPGMNNVPLRDMVGDRLRLPVVLENDANAAAYGEYLCGAGRGTHDMVLLTLGTGVGSGIILGGKILHGSHEMGAELGHLILVPGGEECGCGQRGCLERYCSARYMAERATRRIERDAPDTSLREILDKKGEIDARDINEARRAGDAFAAEVWDEMARYLAQGCVDICRIFDPDKIILAGGMTRAGDDLLDPVREHFAELHWSMTETMTELVIASLGADAGAIGAAGVAWQALGN